MIFYHFQSFLIYLVFSLRCLCGFFAVSLWCLCGFFAVSLRFLCGFFVISFLFFQFFCYLKLIKSYIIHIIHHLIPLYLLYCHLLTSTIFSTYLYDPFLARSSKALKVNIFFFSSFPKIHIIFNSFYMWSSKTSIKSICLFLLEL